MSRFVIAKIHKFGKYDHIFQKYDNIAKKPLSQVSQKSENDYYN